MAKTYKDFLTPALHQRFVNGIGLLLLACWIEATLLSGWSIATVFRTFLLLLPCLGIFILRTSNLHFGKRNTLSAFQAIRSTRISVFVWYLYAALFFGETYIWSGENLGWIDHGRAYERPRMNENPIILRSFFFLLACIQSFNHIYEDLDQVPITIEEPKPFNGILALADHAKPIAKRVFNTTFLALLAISPIYFVILRPAAWSAAYFLGSLVVPQLPHSSPPGLTHVTTLLWQAATSSVLLLSLVEISNAVYTIYMQQPPLKRGQPLTSDKAPDPNGSLINGLKARRSALRTSAMRELYLICAHFPARRTTIFAEVDRADGNTWSQISQICLAEIEAVNTRIAKAQQPPSPPQPQVIQGLPRIAEPAKEGDIYNKRQDISTMIRAAGQHPGASPVVPRDLGQAQLKELSKDLNSWLLKFLQTPLGEPFRETFVRTASLTVFGEISTQLNIILAVRSLVALLNASLSEDTCGIVAKDVASILRTLIRTNQTVRQYVETLQPKQTDVFFRPQDRQISEIAELTSELRAGIKSIVDEFAEYADSLAISRKELREAKEVIDMKR